MDRCAAALKEAAGEEIAANAAGVAALFAAITIPVDASGHSSPELAKLQPVGQRKPCLKQCFLDVRECISSYYIYLQRYNSYIVLL